MSKAVIVARNGVDPTGQGRKALSLDKGTPALKEALLNRLRIVADYGCHVTDVRRLREAVNSIITNEEGSMAKRSDLKSHSTPAPLNYSGKLVTAADIRHAQSLGAKLGISSASLITPLARDLAVQRGVAFVESDYQSRHEKRG